MENEILINKNSSSFNEIVFENRNKDFGAYLLRALYANHIIIALAASISFISVCLCSPLIYNYFFPKEIGTEPIEEIVKVDIMEIASEIEKITIPLPPQVKTDLPKISTVKFLPPKVVEDIKADTDENVPTTDELKEAVASTETTKGDSSFIKDSHIASEVPSAQKGETYISVSRSAEFPKKSLKDYLQSHLRYPSKARRQGIQGVVTVHFVVSAEGNITNASIIKGLEEECDAEALRVVNSMPKWKPAMQNGFNVKQPMNVRIEFIIDENE